MIQATANSVSHTSGAISMAKKDKGTSKVDMVRDAIGKIGWDAGIDDYQKYIKDAYGVEMSKAHISQTKSNEKKRQGIRRRRRRRGRPAADGQAPAGTAKLTDVLSFVSTVQEWEQKIGAKTVREVVKSVLKK
jgi:hypothetical protein